MDAVQVHWPSEPDRRAFLASARVPRLLLVEPGAPPPLVEDALEDWIRLPAEPVDVEARLHTLAARAADGHPRPELDDDGILRFGECWVALSPVERALARVLVERFRAVVGRDTLGRSAWPGGAPTRNALDVHVLRLRRRLAAVGLEIRTVRSRGYLMQPLAVSTLASLGGSSSAG